MRSQRLLAVAAVLALALSACSPDAPPADDTGAANDATDDGSASMPPPAPPAPPSPPSVPEPPAPAPDRPVYDETVVNFGGYRTATFNSDADAVRAAWTGTLQAQPPPESPDACHYLMPEKTGPDGYGTAFMFEGGKFVRIDVDTAGLVAPGGLVTGMTAADVRAAFPDVEEQPHKYIDGKYLVVAPADGGEGRLVFEVDEQGTITEWRMGLEPQVHYVEGCS